jgi:hypothetical protein
MYHTSARGHAFRWPEALRIGFVALAAALVWFSMWEPIAAVSVIGVAGLLIGGWPICKEAFESAVMALSALPESVTKRTSSGHGRIAKLLCPINRYFPDAKGLDRQIGSTWPLPASPP